MRLHSGDTVKILSGKDRGKTGKVTAVLPRASKVIVEGVNVKKKHRRSRRQDRKGEVILVPAPLAAAAVMLVCPSCAKPTRVGYREQNSGKKDRICKRCGAAIA